MEVARRILVVEDDELSASFLEEALKIYGYDVTVANNGKSGLDYYEANPFPVVISDLEMPIMSGRDLILKLASTDIPPHVIVQTAHNEANTIIDIMKLGVYDYLIKPIHINALILTVVKAFESYQLRQHTPNNPPS